MEKFDVIVKRALENLTDEDIRELEKTLNRVYGNEYVHTTWKEARVMIVEDYVEAALEVQEFKGEYANEYETHYQYVSSGAFEKDYFSAWLEGCSDYPYLGEIKDFCETVDNAIQVWLYLAELGVFENQE